MGSDSPLSPLFASTQFYKRGKLNGGGGGRRCSSGAAPISSTRMLPEEPERRILHLSIPRPLSSLLS